MHRQKLIAGNWKMNKTSTDAGTLVKERILAAVGRQNDVDVVTSARRLHLPGKREPVLIEGPASEARGPEHAPGGLRRLHR